MLKEFSEIEKDEYDLSILLLGVGLCSVCSGSKHLGISKSFKYMSCLGCSGVMSKTIIDVFSRKREIEKKQSLLKKSYDDFSKIKKQSEQKKLVADRVKMFKGPAPKFVSHRGMGVY